MNKLNFIHSLEIEKVESYYVTINPKTKKEQLMDPRLQPKGAKKVLYVMELDCFWKIFLTQSWRKWDKKGQEQASCICLKIQSLVISELGL